MTTPDEGHECDAVAEFIELIHEEVSVPDSGFICRPALSAPQCGSLRCVAICVCASGLSWAPAYEYGDDDATDVDEEDEEDAEAASCAPTVRRHSAQARTDEGDGPLEISLWEAIDEFADYESDAERYQAEAEDTTPSPREPVLPPLRKRPLADGGRAPSHPAKYGRFGMTDRLMHSGAVEAR